MRQRIYIVEFSPQGSDTMLHAQSMNPFQLLMECASQYRLGICKATIRPLMLNGRFMCYENGKRMIIVPEDDGIGKPDS